MILKFDFTHCFDPQQIHVAHFELLPWPLFYYWIELYQLEIAVKYVKGTINVYKTEQKLVLLGSMNSFVPDPKMIFRVPSFTQ